MGEQRQSGEYLIFVPNPQDGGDCHGLCVYVIHVLESDGELVWQAMAESLVVARVKVKTLMDVQPGDYVICSQRTGHKMVIKPDGSVTPRVSS